MREAENNSRYIFLSVVGAYVVRTSNLNDKHSCQFFRMGLRDKTTPSLTTPLIRADMSCAVATIFSSLVFLSSFGSCIILQSCSSFFFSLHGQPELFAMDFFIINIIIGGAK